jgi:hypothetical protein
MKMYVSGWDIRPEFKEANEAGTPIPDAESSDVFYNPNPVWTFPSKEHADVEFRIAQRMRFHVGLHYCEVELEQLASGEFAIVCNDHPQPAS